MSNPRSNTASSVREQKLARVIDREVAPIWHDRFARLMLRDLPTTPELFALDVHSGPGHTTAELLHRLDESARVVALGRDPWLMQVSKTRVRPEWKRRVYFKSGDIDDVTGMNDDTYDLAFANLVLGEQVVDWQPALAELARVTKPGGQVVVTLPLYGTWQEVEDLFEELLRDEGMRKEVATLQNLRRRRPKPSQLIAGARELGLKDSDFVIEHERFELLFRSGREFLFAPVIEHGPLRLWKAILGRAEKPQALFWRFKETIDTYYSGRVLAVTVIAGLVRLQVPGGASADSFISQYWSRYPSLARLWGVNGARLDASEDDFDLDIDLDLDEAIDNLTPNEPDEPAPEQDDAAAASSDQIPFELDGGFGRGFDDVEVSGANELPAIEDAVLGDDDDPFASLLEELDAEAAARAEVEAEDAEVEATVSPRKQTPSGRLSTLASLGNTQKAGDSGSAPKPKPTPAASESVSAPIPKLPPRTESVAARAPVAPPRTESVAARAPAPPPPRTESVIGKAPPPPRTESVVGKAPPPPRTESVVGKAPVKPPPRSDSSITPIPKPPPPRSDSSITPIPKPPPPRSDSSITPIPKPPPPRSDSSITPIPKPPPSGGKLSDKLPPRGGSLASRLPKRAPGEVQPPGTVRSPGESGTGSLLSRLPKRTPSGPSNQVKPPAPPKTGPMPQVTKPGEDDPFASMVDDAEDIDDIDDIDDIEELAGDSLLHGELDEDEDFAESFANIKPDPAAGRSGSRPIPPKKK